MAVFANPERFDGTYLGLRGYLSTGFEESVLFIDQAAFHNRSYFESIWLSTDPRDRARLREAQGRQVFVYGDFSLGPCGHLSTAFACLQVRGFWVFPPNGTYDYDSELCREPAG